MNAPITPAAMLPPHRHPTAPPPVPLYLLTAGQLDTVKRRIPDVTPVLRYIGLIRR